VKGKGHERTWWQTRTTLHHASKGVRGALSSLKGLGRRGGVCSRGEGLRVGALHWGSFSKKPGGRYIFLRASGFSPTILEGGGDTVRGLRDFFEKKVPTRAFKVITGHSLGGGAP